MAIIRVTPIADYRSADEDDKGQLTYVLGWDVVTSAATVGAREVLSHASLPVRGDTYASFGEADVDAWCIRIRARQNQEQKHRWIVTAEFSSEFDNPFTRPAVVEIEGDTEEIVDTTVRNSAGEPFESQPTTPLAFASFSIQRNLAPIDFNWSDYESLLGTTNDPEFTVPVFDVELGVGKCLFKKYRVRHVVENYRTANEVEFIQVTGYFESRDIGFIRYYLDAGYRHLETSPKGTSRLVVNRDRLGVPFQRPQRLNGSGVLLASGDADVFISHTPNGSGDFSLLKLEDA